MTDEQIRQILIERKKQAAAMQRKEEIKETVEGILAWAFWAAGGYIFYLLAYAAM